MDHVGDRPSEDGRSSVVEATALLSVLDADATPEQVAALVAVLSAMGAGTGTGTDIAPAGATPEWQANHRKLRLVPPHGPGGWRSSGLPH